MIKVLIVAGTMDVGGIENQLMHLARKADKSKYQFSFTTTIDNPYYKEEIESLGGHCIKIRPTGGICLIGYCYHLFRLIRNGKYDIVYSHELFHSGLVLFTARIAGVKARFVHAHNWTDLNSLTDRRPLIRSIYNSVMRCLIVHNATEFCACSSYAGKFLYGEKVTHQGNYHLIYNSVDTTKYLKNYDDVKNCEEYDDGWITVLNVGRFCEQKNQLFLVKIADEFRKRNQKIKILCVGDFCNTYGEAVVNQISINDLAEYMQLLGVRSDVDNLLRSNKAFVLPSQYEGMPLALIEAQASGIPCIAADTFSHEVDFETGNLQWLKISDSPEIWADAIQKAVNQPRAKKEDVIDAIQKKGFDSQSFADTICGLFEESTQ